MIDHEPNDNRPGSYHRPRPPLPPVLAPSPRTGGPTMPVLTVYEPYASHIVFGSKRIENRDWKPLKHLLGKRIAIHAAIRPLSSIDIAAAAEQARAAGSGPVGFPLVELDARRGHIIGTAVIAGWFESGMGAPEPWEVGRYCWRLADVRPCTPIRAKGAQGVWQFDSEQVRAADRQWHRDNGPRVAAN